MSTQPAAEFRGGMIRQLCRLRFAAIGLLSLVSLNACSVEQQLPVGSELSISPSERTLMTTDRVDENGNCFINPDYYVDWAIVLSLVDSNGVPVGNQAVRVYLDFAANTHSGYPVMALYDDRRGNNNGVVDDFELVSDTEDDIAIVNTDLYGGDRPLLLRVNVSCPFRGQVFAFVDGVSAQSNIEINARTDESAPVAGRVWESGL